MRNFSVLLSAAMLSACGSNHGKDDAIALDWNHGDAWHVAARYHLASGMTEETPVSLDGTVAPSFGDQWSDEVVWTYEVVEEGLQPSPADELYEYAVKTNGDIAPIAVIKASIDASLNDDPEILDADPVVYLVFREDRGRLAAIVQFENVDGERVQKAWSSSRLDRSWSALSQSMLTAAPTYLAPFGTRWAAEDRVLENGSLVTTETPDARTVDTYYDDEVGGGLVMTRYEAGQPWPTWTATDNVEARLVDDRDLEARRAQLRTLFDEPAGDFDYIAALTEAVDIDAALTLDADTIDGGYHAEAKDGYKPWAGSWWPQSKSALVFGYDDRDTISDRIKADIDPLKIELDGLSESLRTLDKTSADYTTKLNTYQAKQSELVTKLVTFYDGVRADLDGGRLKIANGKLTHVDGWSYDLDELSPMDKLALQLYVKGGQSSNPFYLPAWELLNHYSPKGGSWWGHCNGWSGAAILTNEPRVPVQVALGDQQVTYTTADLKGLFSEAHYSTTSRFYGSRFNGDEGDDVADLTPKAFHIIVTHYLRDRQVPFVFDTVATEEVWNFPAYDVDMKVTETTPPGALDDDWMINLNTATTFDFEWLISGELAASIIDYRESHGAFQSVGELKDVTGMTDSDYEGLLGLVTVGTATGERTFDVSATVTIATDGVSETHVDGSTPQSNVETWDYTLVTDKDGLVLRGTWKDERSHPDFAWVPYDNPAFGASGSSENPFLPYGDLLSVVGDGFRRH
jgi:hypothetical protein